MKKLLTLILTVMLGLVAVFGLTACSKEKDDTPTLYVYTHAGFAPFEFLDEKGKLIGVDLAVMQEIGNILGYKIVVNDIDFGKIFTEVSGNKNAVGAAGISKKPERDAICLSTDEYFKSTQYVIAPKGTFAAGAKVTVDQIASAVGAKKIGVQNATTGADLVNKDYSAKVISYPNAIVASTDINSTLGAVVIDKLPAISICKANSSFDYWEVDAEVESYVLYFNQSQGDLVKEVNAIIKYMNDSGFIDYLVAKYSGEILQAAEAAIGD